MATPTTLANSINSIVNQSDSGGASSSVFQAIKSAASKTGVDFSYLLKKAAQESGFDPSAKASTSSATGLFQFTSQTWLQMVKQYGAQYGLGDQAAQISADSTGHLKVADPVARQAILALRKDPAVSAEMAGELDKANAASLQQNVGGKIGGTELYLAHFLGAGGASDFISEMRSNPQAVAADVLPTAAASNPSVFYDKDGDPRTLQQIYQHFAQKFDGKTTMTQVASAAPAARVSAPTTSAYQSTLALNSMPTATAATANIPAGASYGANPIAARSQITLASAGSSTLFDTMILGQVQGSQTASPLGLLNQIDKKKGGYTSLGAAA